MPGLVQDFLVVFFFLIDVISLRMLNIAFIKSFSDCSIIFILSGLNSSPEC